MSNRRIDLLEELRRVPWSTLARVYGNCHPTMIGLVTRWWLELSPDTHWVLDGAPSYAIGNRGRADAVLCDDHGPSGVLEVEASYQAETAKKVGKYLASRRKELAGMWFGILVLYSYEPEGSGAARHFPAVQDPALHTIVQKLTAQHPGNEILAVTIEKSFDSDTSGIRATRDYYKGALKFVRGISYVSGKERDRKAYYGTDGV